MATNRTTAAFKEGPNVIGLATLAAVSAATLNPIPLLAGAVAEAGYLLFVPDSRWYRDRLQRRADAEDERRRRAIEEKVLPVLPAELQRRYARLVEVRAQISAQPVDDETWFREVQHKLDYLLEKFLLFADKERQFGSYLRFVHAEARGEPPRSAPSPRRPDEDRRGPRPRSERDSTAFWRPDEWAALAPDQMAGTIADVQASYDSEIASLRKEDEAETDPNTKAIVAKRISVLERRREFLGRIQTITTNLDHQLKLVEDTFGLISDEIRARSPEQILADIDDVVLQADTMTQVLEEVAPYEQLAARLAG